MPNLLNLTNRFGIFILHKQLFWFRQFFRLYIFHSISFYNKRTVVPSVKQGYNSGYNKDAAHCPNNDYSKILRQKKKNHRY